MAAPKNDNISKSSIIMRTCVEANFEQLCILVCIELWATFVDGNVSKDVTHKCCPQNNVAHKCCPQMLIRV